MLRLIQLPALLLALAAPLHAHHGPPHDEEDEFLKPRDKVQAVTWREVLPGLAVPVAFAVLMLGLSFGPKKSTPAG